jgi:hypothetical protein
MTDGERSAIIAALGRRRAMSGGICEVKSNGAHLDTVLEIAGTTPSPPWNGGEGRGEEVPLKALNSQVKPFSPLLRHKARETKIKNSIKMHPVE